MHCGIQEDRSGPFWDRGVRMNGWVGLQTVTLLTVDLTVRTRSQHPGSLRRAQITEEAFDSSFNLSLSVSAMSSYGEERLHLCFSSRMSADSLDYT